MPNKNHTQIHSIKETCVIRARECSTHQGRSQHQSFLLYGEEQINWAMKANVQLECLFCTPQQAENLPDLPPDCEICLASEGILKKISGTSYLVPLLAVGKQPAKAPWPPKDDLVLILDELSDYGNIGTIIRTSVAFGVKHIALCNMQTDIYFRKTMDASRGNVFNTNLSIWDDSLQAVNALKTAGYQIIATTPTGSKIQSSVKLQARPAALIIGNETHGIRKDILELADFCVQIPMQPNVESLNVGVAAGISLYEIKIKAVFAMITKKIRSTLGRELNCTSRWLIEQLDREIQPLCGISANQAIFLMMLSCDREMSTAQICQDTARFGNELIEFLDPIIQNQWMQPVPNLPDHWEISENGERWLAELWPLVERSEEKVLAGFTSTERTQFFGFLKRIQNNCQKEGLSKALG